MLRLSIIVPALGDQSLLDGTLVSVLENRPRNCEILVVCPRSYHDPYGLEDEITFVRAEGPASWTCFANAGLKHASGNYVQLLQPGVEVLEGWAEPPITCLQQHRQIGSVAPLLVVDGSDSDLGLAGILYRKGGKRVPHHIRLPAVDQGRSSLLITGPTMWSGIFRGADLQDVGGWNPLVSPLLADLDLALRLWRLGYRSVCDTSSWGYLNSKAVASQPQASAFELGRDAEQLFWRHAGAAGWMSSLVCHSLTVAHEWAAQLPSHRALSGLWGRLVGMLQWEAQADLREGVKLRRQAAAGEESKAA